MIVKTLWMVTILLIIRLGLILTFKFKFIQFNLKKMLKGIKNSSNENLLPSLFLTLGGRIGVGSIAGVALAIYLGGSGTIFWIWVITLISAPITYLETILGIKYQKKDGKLYKGGAPYYIKEGLNKNVLAFLYAILIIISYTIGFISIQANTIAKTINELINIKPLIIGIIIAIIVIIIIKNGLLSIMKVTNKIVPFMLIIYLLCGIFVIITNVNLLDDIFINIIKNAFNFKSAITGFLTTLIIGIQRGIFANESGLGIVSLASSANNSKDPKISGYTQIIGVYITTFLICTITAIIILTSNYNFNISDINGIEIALNAFKYHFGILGHFILVICIILFSFSTILTGYYYSETCLKIFNIKSTIVLKMITFLILIIGSIMKAKIIWNMVDIFVLFLALINIYTINKLRKTIKL